MLLTETWVDGLGLGSVGVFLAICRSGRWKRGEILGIQLLRGGGSVW